MTNTMSMKILLLSLLSIAAQAQWVNYRTPGTPRTPDGKADLRARTPKALDGKPDLSGVWMHEVTTPAEMKRLYGQRIDEAIAVDVPGMEIGTQHRYAFNILLDFPPKESPIRPAAAEAMRRLSATNDPAKVCSEIGGIPLIDLLSEPIKIVQSPRLTLMLYEVGSVHRQIYTDGRDLPTEFDLPAFLGYSIGRWEGDTLVVETAGFNDRTALDLMGHPHSDA